MTRNLHKDSPIPPYMAYPRFLLTMDISETAKLVYVLLPDPELCKQTDDDGQGGLRFEIDKSRISIRLTAPYSEDRRKAASELAKKRGIHTKTN